MYYVILRLLDVCRVPTFISPVRLRNLPVNEYIDIKLYKYCEAHIDTLIEKNITLLLYDILF